MTAALDLLGRHGLANAEDRLREYLPRQRWFGGRDRALDELRVVDVGVLQDDDPTVLSVIVEVEYPGADRETYFVPLAVQAEGSAGIWEGVVVGAGERDGQPVLVYDALHGGEPSFALWRAVAAGREIPMERGRLVCRNVGLELGAAGAASVRPLGREQSNSSLVRADLEVMKCFRKLARGRSPELEMLEALAGAGFPHVAAPLGMIEYHDGDEPALLALVQPYLHNGTDGWTLALSSLRDLYAHAEETGVQERRHALRVVEEQGASFEPEAERLGRVTAQMHLALASTGLEGDMRPERAGPERLKAWSEEMIEDLDRLLAQDDDRLAELRRRRAPIVDVFQAITGLGQGGLAIRYHGDYHLGQLLRTDSGWTVLDFEGEPARGAEARRARSSPLRDVAGMLRSFDYAAAVELRAWAKSGDSDFARMELYGEAWCAGNREVFWNAYTDELQGASIIPPGDQAGLLRRAFELQKAVYEVGYELGHRPEWVDIPLGFLLREG